MSPNKAKLFLQQFYYHLDNHSTGSPLVFATKLGVSRATLYRFIAELRDEGINIRFSRNQNCFYRAQTTINELAKQAIIQANEAQSLLTCVLPPQKHVV